MTDINQRRVREEYLANTKLQDLYEEGIVSLHYLSDENGETEAKLAGEHDSLRIVRGPDHKPLGINLNRDGKILAFEEGGLSYLNIFNLFRFLEHELINTRLRHNKLFYNGLKISSSDLAGMNEYEMSCLMRQNQNRESTVHEGASAESGWQERTAASRRRRVVWEDINTSSEEEEVIQQEVEDDFSHQAEIEREPRSLSR